MGKVHDVIALREVTAPVPSREGEQWMTLAAAMASGIPLDDVRDAIGPRVPGMVYRSGYWGSVNTVHGVFVLVIPSGRDGRGRFRPRRATWWQVAVESADDCGRIRRHCTSWEYDQFNQPLFMI